MFRPKLPDVPTLPTASVVPQQTHVPVPSAGRSLTPYAGAVAAVVVVGVVLTALLAAVAITAISVAIAAVVLRSLVNGANRR
ncbi:SpdD protein [Streptomyces sp. NPDC001536]|uniref:SpdD protein n=1 Tax=Streptomyces sp. NPDC001536 TaxID=3364583 RepID=UPI0036B8DB2F